MFEYTIAAIPTVYNGVKYRSRLEARWAAFFDLLGWRHTYEPYDMGTWSPDFLVRSNADDSGSILVEVKPVEVCCDDTLKRMLKACAERGSLAGDSNLYGAALVGVAPSASISRYVSVGWLINRLTLEDGEYYPVDIGWLPELYTPGFSADLIHLAPRGGLWFSVMSGDACGPDYPKAYADYTRGLWNKACNTVQWIGRQSP